MQQSQKEDQQKRKKKDKLKIKPNIDINVEDYISLSQNQQFKDFFQGKFAKSGYPSFIVMNVDYIFIGTQSSFIFLSQQDGNFKHDYKVMGHESKKHRGAVTFMELSSDNSYLLVTYANREFVLWSLEQFKEIYSSTQYKLHRAFFVPIIPSAEYLQQIKKEQYYEILIHEECNNISKLPIEMTFLQVQGGISTNIVKYGEPCHLQKFKEVKRAVSQMHYNQKIQDEEEYIAPFSKQIIDIKIMDSKLEEHIQCMDDRESGASFLSTDSQRRKSSGRTQKKKKNSLVSRLFSKQIEEPEPQFVYSPYFYLIALTYPQKVVVIKVVFGNRLNGDQCKILTLLSFARPDAHIYDLVFSSNDKQQVKPQSMQAQQLMMNSTCSWGLGNFKETNKRYVLLIVNWGGREYYAFKVMTSDGKLQVIQGGHFFHPLDYNQVKQMPLICDFISNSIMYSFYIGDTDQSAVMLMTTSQFEYGVPFNLTQIQKHTAQEMNIKNISSGQYQPKFYQYTRDSGEQVIISQGVMDSINDGLQNSNKIKLSISNLSSNFQIKASTESQQLYILNGLDLYTIRLKKWDEYLYELSDASEWDKCFQTAIDIHRGALTLLGNIPENDMVRHHAIKETCCKLALTYMLLQLPNKQLRSQNSVLEVMNFLIETSNEDFLFKSIEDLLVGCGYRLVFYEYLRDLFQNHQTKVPSDHLLRVLKMYKELNDEDTVIKLIMSQQNISYDAKYLVDFCIEHDLIEPMMHVCSQTSDFLTPYLRILTLLQIQQFQQTQPENGDRQITTLTVQQLQSYVFKYIQFCLTGQFTDDQDNFFTDKQYKIMLKDLFEYLFELSNLEQLFKINYHLALKVFLLVFQPKIQDMFKQLNQAGREVNIHLPRILEEGLLSEILKIEKTPPYLLSLSKIYVLIKQAELTYFGQVSNVDSLYSISAAFTSHVVAICPLQFELNHLLLHIKHYIGLLRDQEDTIFDIQWALKGRVQKDVSSELIRNEFILKIIEKIDPLFTNKVKALEELKQKAVDSKWTWLECWCLQKLGRITESFHRYLLDPEVLVSERVFVMLSSYLKLKQEEAIQDWMIKNILLLAQESTSKLFQVIITNCKDVLPQIAKEMIVYNIVEVDHKIDRRQENLALLFFKYLSPRIQLDNDMKELQKLCID